MLVSHFNDVERNNTTTLAQEINRLPNIGRLKYQPVISCGEVDDEAERYFNQIRLIPTFSFIDPFGYKGLSLKIVKGVIKDWGCDCVFFFNYNRINAGITNDCVAPHINALFSEARANELRSTLPGLRPYLREAAIMEALVSEIRDLGGKFVLPFTFKNATGSRTTHKLIFVSKNFKGYEIMKDIMAKESSTEDEGVPSFTCSPADVSMLLQFSLFEPIFQPMSQLRESLLNSFAGREIIFDEIYKVHSVDKPYIRKNYRKAIIKLEEDGVVSAYSSRGKRRGRTYPSHVFIKFPESRTHGD